MKSTFMQVKTIQYIHTKDRPKKRRSGLHSEVYIYAGEHCTIYAHQGEAYIVKSIFMQVNTIRYIHTKKYCEKRKVFSLALKDDRVEQCLRSCGSEFQMWGPKQEN